MEIENMESGPARLVQRLKHDDTELNRTRNRFSKIDESLESYLNITFDKCYFCEQSGIETSVANSHTVPESKLEIISEGNAIKKVVDLSLQRILFKKDVGNLFDSLFSIKKAGVFNRICRKHDNDEFSIYEDCQLNSITQKQMNAVALKTSLAANYFYTKQCYQMQIMYGTPRQMQNWDQNLYDLCKSFSDCALLGLSAATNLFKNDEEFTLLCNILDPNKPVFAMQGYFSVPNETNEVFRVYVNVLPEANGNRILVFTDAEDVNNDWLKAKMSLACLLICGLVNMRFTSFLSPSLSLAAQDSSLHRIVGSQSVYSISQEEEIDIMKLLNLNPEYSNKASWSTYVTADM